MVMKRQYLLVIYTAVLLLLSGHEVFPQQVTDERESNQDDRRAVFAGQFYPGNAKELNAELEKFFSRAPGPKKDSETAALVSPHAGYRYSGQVAAAAYKQLDPRHDYKNIFILAPSHRVRFEGASIYSTGDYLTPLGRVQVNKALARKLIDQYDFFKHHPPAHEKEHSLEVQLPFLQHHLHNEFRIVPIVTGTHDPRVISRMAEALRPFFNGDNLFVVSTDFSHYPAYRDAVEVDHATARAIASNNPEKLVEVIRSNSRKGISRLATSMCGWPGMLAMLNLTGKGSSEVEVQKIMYRNSGDVTGDSSRVVGYWAMAMVRKKGETNMDITKKAHMDFHLNEEEKNVLLGIARRTLETYVRKGQMPQVEEQDLTETLKVQTGAFVTLTSEGELRGCIGRFQPEMPLYKVVQKMAVAASSEDARFLPVGEEELDDITIEISVLTPMEKVSSPEDIELGRDGIYIKKGHRAGTLLPQVAEKRNWTREQFLGYCARDKAGIGWNGWKDEDTELYAYQAIVFKEQGDE